MSRDWANEPWRKLYINESPEDAMLTWQARCLWPLLIARCDRSGIVEVQPGPRQMRALAALLRIPEEVVAPGVEDLLADTRLVAIVPGFWLRNFEEAQRARKSAKLRMAESRERRAHALRAATLGCETQQNVLNRREEIKTSKAPLVAAVAPLPSAGAERVEVKKTGLTNFSSTTSIHPSALSEREGFFLQGWNELRELRGMKPEELLTEQRESFLELLDDADYQAQKHELDLQDLCSLLICAFLDDEEFRSKKLRTFLSQKVWPERLESAVQNMRLSQRPKNRRRM